MTTNRDTVTEWIEAQGETDTTMLATAILDASHALAAIHEQLRIANLIALAAEGWTTSDRIADSAWAALEALTEPDPDSTKPRNQLRPRIAAALGIPWGDPA